MPDDVTRSTTIQAPLSRVWQAISDHREFGTWFKAHLDQPFAEGQEVTGHMTEPGFEDLPFGVRVVAVRPETYLAFRWPPFDPEAKAARPDLPWTLVEFRLSETPDGTRVEVTESGFDALPEPIRSAAIASNGEGWRIQMERVGDYVADAA